VLKLEKLYKKKFIQQNLEKNIIFKKSIEKNYKFYLFLSLIILKLSNNFYELNINE
jgi:hypothetical protein